MASALGWDPSNTLSWGSRGLGPAKMVTLRDTLLQNTHLTGIQLGGGYGRRGVEEGGGGGVSPHQVARCGCGWCNGRVWSWTGVADRVVG